jgi:hypothetical protein
MVAFLLTQLLSIDFEHDWYNEFCQVNFSYFAHKKIKIKLE